jgi:ATP-dependent Clp protease ATP-binding subunit ClpC
MEVELLSLLLKDKSKSVNDITFSHRSLRVFELAWDESKMMGHDYVGTEHLLLGLLREGGGLAATVMKKMGLELGILRKHISQMVYSNKKPQSPDEMTDESFPISDFTVDLTEQASEGKLDPTIGRNVEIQRLIQILSRRKKNNPVLIGEAGVGKTAIVEGLAQRIVNRDVPMSLHNKMILSLDMPSVIAGTKYRGQFEERLKAILNQITNNDEIIVFIDEIHTIVGAGAAEGAIDASNILKPALARGEIQCIGATTLEEYRKYIEKDGSLERRFQTVMVEPSTIEETKEILKGLRHKYEDHHQVKLPDEVIDISVRLTDRYINDRLLPDKAIDVIDEAMAMVKLENEIPTSDAEELLEDIRGIAIQRDAAISKKDYELAAHLRDEEDGLRERYTDLLENYSEGEGERPEITLTPENILLVISRWTGIPLTKMEMTETERLMNMEEALHKRVVGQDEAINAVTRAIRRSRTGVKDSRKPIGGFLFLGPTGVGKTELAKTLAEFLFDDEDALIRLDMSEYMERFAVSRLMGAPPGYVGYEEGGQLTERVRRRPYSVILLDEIEKAHPDVFNILLQILEDGRLTDSFGRTVSFRNSVIIMTSNIGAREIKDGSTIGFQSQSSDLTYSMMKHSVMGEVKKVFNLEFLNRLDEIIVFHALEKHHLVKIISIMMRDVKERLKEHSIEINLSEKAKEFLIDEGFDPNFGARPLRRTIQRHIEDPIAEMMISKNIISDVIVDVDYEDDELVFDLKNEELMGVKGD